MRNDFDLIVHRLPECKEARLYVIGDLHVGAIESNIKGWEQFTQKILQDKNAYIVILGDMAQAAGYTQEQPSTATNALAWCWKAWMFSPWATRTKAR